MSQDFSRMTPRQRAHYTYLMDVMSRLEWDLHRNIHRAGRIPPEWHEIARTTPRQVKHKVTLELEVDVLKFFKSMGKGHGPRMNDVLRSYMHARLAGLIDGAETLEIYRAAETQTAGPLPEFGDTARKLAGE